MLLQARSQYPACILGCELAAFAAFRFPSHRQEHRTGDLSSPKRHVASGRQKLTETVVRPPNARGEYCNSTSCAEGGTCQYVPAHLLQTLTFCRDCAYGCRFHELLPQATGALVAGGVNSAAAYLADLRAGREAEKRLGIKKVTHRQKSAQSQRAVAQA